MTSDWRPSCSIEALRTRAGVMAQLRQFFSERDVLEVQTSILAAHTVTEVAIDSMLVGGLGYLQTSPEYQMKRLLAAGAPSIYQITPVFRAGEAGRLHNPEFTMLEWYRLGFDDRALMAEVSDLVTRVLGPAKTEYLAYGDLITDLDRPRDELDLAISEAIDALGNGRYFITRYPADQAALARLQPDDPTVSARFELVIDGVEVANGYWELTDPREQRLRFAMDIERRRQLGLVEPSVDERLLACLDAGLPECAGVALGIDRLLMHKMGVRRLADVMPFPIDRA